MEGQSSETRPPPADVPPDASGQGHRSADLQSALRGRNPGGSAGACGDSKPTASRRSGPEQFYSDGADESRPGCGYVGGPGPLRGLLVIAGLILLIWMLAARVETGADAIVQKVGRVEVTARLVERPDQFPKLGAYRYTYVLKYKVISVHRQDPEGKHPLKTGDEIFVGHYKPWLPRSEIKDSDWGDSPLGGKLDGFVAGEVHRLALDYELQDLAPSGALDYCFPPATNRFFALWTNRTTY